MNRNEAPQRAALGGEGEEQMFAGKRLKSPEENLSVSESAAAAVSQVCARHLTTPTSRNDGLSSAPLPELSCAPSLSKSEGTSGSHSCTAVRGWGGRVPHGQPSSGVLQSQARQDLNSPNVLGPNLELGVKPEHHLLPQAQRDPVPCL